MNVAEMRAEHIHPALVATVCGGVVEGGVFGANTKAKKHVCYKLH